MSAEIEKYLNLLEQHLSLLRALARQFTDCRKEFIALDLDGMYCRIAEQEQLCRQIQSLHPAIDLLQRTCAQQRDLRRLDAARQLEEAAWAERLRNVMQELGETQAEVRRLNQVHAAYLRRSRRTVDMMMNFL
jgi:hypothetical protein